MKKSAQKIHILNVWTILSLVTVLICILSYVGYHYVINSYNTYTDFLVGEAAYLGTNKVSEWHLFWLLLFIAMGLTGVLAFLEKKKDFPVVQQQTKWAMISGCMYLPLLVHLIIYEKLNLYFCILTIFVSIVTFIYREHALIKIAGFTCVYFCIEACAVVLVFKQIYFLTDKKVLAFSFVLYGIFEVANLLWKQKNLDAIINNRIYAIVQLFIPFLFLLYLKNIYQNGMIVEKQAFPNVYIAIILVLIIGLDIVSWYELFVKKENKISFSTAFSVFAFVSYISPAMIIPFDMHHHGEQLLPWQQIMDLGQKAYEEYAPASGLFPMILGFFNRVLFDGQASAYNMSFVMFALLFEGITMYLLYRKVGGEWSLLIAVLFHMPVYCRVWIFLPTLLLWSDKKLIENKSIWLMTYVFVSFLDGLYYPLYGAALMLGALPFAIVQVTAFFKKPDFKKKYLPALIIEGILIVASLPLLLRMLHHILSMSGQTIEVDGMSIFLADVPEWFMPYLKGFGGYSLIYDLFRFVLGIVAVSISVYLLCRFFKMTEKTLEHYRTEQYFMLSCIPPILCICYTYTMVIMDEDWVANLLSRSSHVLLLINGVFLLIYFLKYGKTLLGEKNAFIGCVLAICVPFFFFLECQDYEFPLMEGTTDETAYVVGEYQSKLMPYKLRDGFVHLDDNLKESNNYVQFQQIGEGYISQNVLEKVNKLQLTVDYLRLFDPDIKVLGFEQSQMYYFLLDEKSVYSGRTSIARSRAAVSDVIAKIDPKHTVIRTGIIPLEEYYLYRYLVKAGYSYASDLEMFLPNALYEQIYGYVGNYDASPWVQDSDIYAVANSFAKSLQNIEYFQLVRKEEDVDSKVIVGNVDVDTNNGNNAEAVSGDDTTTIQLHLEQPINGKDADFIYVKFDHVHDGNLAISYSCIEEAKSECTLHAWVKDGELLLPVGINPNWLLYSHDNLTFRITDTSESTDVTIDELAFYHLSELPE